MKTNQKTNQQPPFVYSFARHLQDGETLLWQGKPQVSTFVWFKALRDLPLIVPVLLLAIWLESLRPGGFAFKFGSTAFWCVSLIAYAGSAWYLVRETRRQAQYTCYALTNRRIFIRHLVTLPTQEKQLRVEDFSLIRLRPRLILWPSGSGTVTFGFPLQRYDLAFRALPEAAAIFRLVQEARSPLSPATSAGPYYVKSQSASPPAFNVTEHLRYGEETLWQGKPNAQAYLRQVLPREVLSGIFLVALFGGLGMALLGWFTWLRFGLLVAAGAILAAPLIAWVYTQKVALLSYQVTSQRVIIVTMARSGLAALEERGLAQTQGMRLVSGPNGTGTVVIEKRSKFIWHGQSGTVVTVEFSLKCIDNAAQVLSLITQAREASRAR